jgi:hypothetical protein
LAYSFCVQVSCTFCQLFYEGKWAWFSRVNPSTQWGFLSWVVPLWFPIVCCVYKISIISVHWCCMLRDSLWIRMKSNLVLCGPLRAKLILAPLGMPNWLRHWMDRYRMSFIQTSKHATKCLPNMDGCCIKTTNS